MCLPHECSLAHARAPTFAADSSRLAPVAPAAVKLCRDHGPPPPLARCAWTPCTRAGPCRAVPCRAVPCRAVDPRRDVESVPVIRLHVVEIPSAVAAELLFMSMPMF